MTLRAAPDTSGHAIDGNLLYVDGDTGAVNGNGSDESPFATITLALAAAAAGDEILVRPAAAGYVEDLTLVHNVNITGIGEELAGLTVTGTATAADVGCTIQGLAFIDDGAGSALAITGTLARTLNMKNCSLTSSATGGQVMTNVNTAAIVEIEHCTFNADVANANEAILIAQGTFAFRDSVVAHGSNIVNAILCSGAAAATVTIDDCSITGSVETAVAAVAPDVTIRGGSVTVGAVSAGILAGAAVQRWHGVHVTSADAGNLAFDGAAGNLTISNVSYGGAATGVAAALTTVYQVTSDQRMHPVNVWYVDAAYAGGEATGSQILPYPTVTEAVTAANAGDIIIIHPGAYAENVAIAADIDIMGLCGPLSGAVVITGTMTITDASLSLTNIDLIDDGVAGGALHITGTAADAVVMSGCTVSCTAVGDYAIEHDNTAATLTMFGCRGASAHAANPLFIWESGTLDATSCDFTHGTATLQAFEAQGDAASSITLRHCRFTGSVDAEAAVIAPATFDLDNCSIVSGAAAGLNIAAGCTIRVDGVKINSTEAAQDAVLGAGALTIVTPLVFLASANEIGGTVTPTRTIQSNFQHVDYVEAAGAGARAVVWPQVARVAPDMVSCQYQDTGGGPWALMSEVDTITATGCNITTGGNGTYHVVAMWIA